MNILLKTEADQKMQLDIQKIRQDFPILSQPFGESQKPLIYFDNAATSHKPKQVIDRISNFYACENATVRRGIYGISAQATLEFEKSRERIASFIGASSSQEVVFVRGCTEAINLVARSYGGSNLGEGDEVIISALEHHANIIPWQIICGEKKAKLKIIPINEAGEIQVDQLSELISPKTKIISVSHVSNALGSINPIKEIIQIAHAHNIPVLIDGAQSAPHFKIDVQELDCDFYTFSGHKIYGPTGIGVLYGKRKHLQAMPPFQGGGDMIDLVTFAQSTFAEPPHRFEAGTPAIAEVLGLSAALDYVDSIGLDNIHDYEDQLLQYATPKLQEIDGLKIIGTAKEKASLISFVIDSMHPSDLATLLDHDSNVAVRAGHHCAQPLMQFYKVSSTLRASFAFYNTFEEIDIFIESLKRVISMLR
ncbi:MAG: aminotransferase class V-fold PLP-dependent enzyme [Candidatus Melainabacteria bacterium]|jgi:cysteine desulfurase/selenocysteine lyase